jgi:biotin carboxylase
MSKTLLMIGGGIQEVPAVTRAKGLDYKILVTDRNENAPCFVFADGHKVIDGRDVEGLIAYAVQNSIDGVFTLTELVTSVAAVSDALGITENSLLSAVSCQNKYIASRIFKSANVPHPITFYCVNWDEAQRAINHFGGEAFVKPIVGFGGKGAKRIESAYQIFHKFDEVIIQEYLVGSHHDANGLIDIFGHEYELGITDRKFAEDMPAEIEIRAPTELDERQQAELYDLLFDAARALGIKSGPVKCDAVLVNAEFKILEVAPRLHGPKATLFALPAVGIEPLKPMLQCITGQVIDSIGDPQGEAVMKGRGEEWKLYDGGTIQHLHF